MNIGKINRCKTHPCKIVKRFDVSAICDRFIWDSASRSSFFYSTLIIIKRYFNVIKKLKHPFCDMIQGKDTIIAVKRQ